MGYNYVWQNTLSTAHMTSDVDVHSAGTPEHTSFRDLNTTDASSTENTNLKMTTESLPYNTSLTTANIDTGSNDTYWIQEGKIYMMYLQKATKHSYYIDLNFTLLVLIIKLFTGLNCLLNQRMPILLTLKPCGIYLPASSSLPRWKHKTNSGLRLRHELDSFKS